MKTTGTRIQELRELRFWTKRELAEQLGISESQLSRIENGKTATVSSDILAGLARAFDVSSDYLLGLSPIPDNNHILAELHLSEAACEKLVRRSVDGETLSRLIEHEDFGTFTRLAHAYFADTYAEGVSYRNAILDSGASFLRDHASETEKPKAVREKANDIARAKTGSHEIELTQLHSLSKRILRDAKVQYERERAEHDPALRRRMADEAFSARLREISEEVYAMKGTEDERLDRLTDRVLEDVEQQTGLSSWASKLLKPVYKKIIRSAGQDRRKRQ